MTGLLIIAHAPLASSLKTVAQHAYPDCARLLETLDVPPAMSPDEAERLGRVLLERVCRPEALIMTDVFGATPCNVAQRLADGERIKVVTGVNVPMLWRSLCYAHEPLDAIVGRALAGAAQGVMQVAAASADRPPVELRAHDPKHDHGQQ